jgi:hypothetical protein
MTQNKNQVQATETPVVETPVVVDPRIAVVKSIVLAVRAGTMAKSEAIRQLAGLGVSRWDTSKVLGIRYQFVRNVLVRQAEVETKRAARVAALGASVVESDQDTETDDVESSDS